MANGGMWIVLFLSVALPACSGRPGRGRDGDGDADGDGDGDTDADGDVDGDGDGDCTGRGGDFAPTRARIAPAPEGVLAIAADVSASGALQAAWVETDARGAISVRWAGVGADAPMVETVTVGGALSLALAIDAQDVPHLVWIEPLDDDIAMLRHATRDGAAWNVEMAVPLAPGAGGVAVAVDALGVVHVAHGALDEVRYARREAGTWTTESIEPAAGAGAGVALALGPDGTVQASYPLPGVGVRHAVRGPGGWTVSTAAALLFDLGGETGLAVDASGAAHLAYLDLAELRWATDATGAWVAETIETLGTIPTSLDLALDAEGRPHVAYGDADLRWAVRTQDRWVRDTAVASAGLGAFALEPAGSGHFVALSSREIVHVTAEPPDGVDDDCDGVLDGGCDLRDGDGDGASSERCGGFDCDDGDPGVRPGQAEIACDGADQDCDGEDLRDGDGDHVDCDDDCDDTASAVHPGALETSCDGIDQDCDGADERDVDGDGHDCGADCDDTDPGVHPGAGERACDGVDQDCAGGDLVDADDDGFVCAGAGGDDCDDGAVSRHPGAADLVGDAVDQDCDGRDGRDADGDGAASLVSGGDDCDDGDRNVRPDRFDWVGDAFDSNCDGSDGVDGDRDGHATVASGGDDCADADPAIPSTPDPRPEVVSIDAVGSPVDPAIAIDPQGAAHLAYERLSDGDLVYATNAPGAWVVEVVESEGTTGIRPAITVAADGMVTIVYGAFDAGELRSARGDGGGWTVEVLGTTDVWGNEPRLATAPDGAAHVCFRDTVDQSLRYGRHDGGGWTIETIAADGDGCAIAADGGGAVHLAWGEVQYATNASGAWQIEAVNGDWVWDRLQLVLGPDGAPHIAYFEFWSELVRVATRDEGGQWSVRSRDAGRRFAYRLDAAGRSRLAWEGPDVLDYPLVYEVETDAGIVGGDADAGVVYLAMAVGPDDQAQAAWTADFELRWARLSEPDGIDHDCDGLRW